MLVPNYPDFIPLDVDLKEILHPRLSLTADGVSEFTFSGLYLFRDKYKYRVSRDGSHGSDGGFIISGEQPASTNSPKAKTFFMTPCAAPDWETLSALFKTHDYWKNISESVLSPVRENLKSAALFLRKTGTILTTFTTGKIWRNWPEKNTTKKRIM